MVRDTSRIFISSIHFYLRSIYSRIGWSKRIYFLNFIICRINFAISFFDYLFLRTCFRSWKINNIRIFTSRFLFLLFSPSFSWTDNNKIFLILRSSFFARKFLMKNISSNRVRFRWQTLYIPNPRLCFTSSLNTFYQARRLWAVAP